MLDFKIELEELNFILSHVTSVTNDPAIKREARTVIFEVSEDDTGIALGYTQDISSKLSFSCLEVSGSGRVQVPLVELVESLSAYSNLHRTKVKYVQVKEQNNRVQVLVKEVNLDEEEATDFGGISSYSFNNVPIRSNVEAMLASTAEGGDEFSGIDISIILNILLPSMSPKKGVLTNKIHFSEEFVFVKGTRSNLFVKNALSGEIFKDISLFYSSVAYLVKLAEFSGSLTILKEKGVLHISSFGDDGRSIFTSIKYAPMNIEYKTLLDSISKENGVVLDRYFLQDILRRFNDKDDLVVIFEEGGVVIKTSSLERTIPILNSKGEIGSVKFKINATVLKDLILGDAETMGDSLYLYLDKNSGRLGYSVEVADSKGVSRAITSVG